MKTALIAGSTGLIGKQLLTLLLATDRYSKVIALTRKELPVNNSKLITIIPNFSKLEEYATDLQADDVFCCLGTTIAKVKTKEKFFEVDYTYPVKLAEVSKKVGAKQYMLVSALGADKSSSIYYNQVKGQVEEAITKVSFDALHIFRPSLLLGDREEKRVGEDAAKTFFKLFGFLVPGKYKGIDVSKVAKGMLHFASQEQKGNFIHESLELQKF